MAVVRKPLVGAVLLVTVLAVNARSAHAEDAEKARQLFTQGSKYYDVGQFDKAIEAWQAGYDQKPDPSFLYNIAQAYRQKEDHPAGDLLLQELPPEFAQGRQPRRGGAANRGPAKTGGRHHAQDAAARADRAPAAQRAAAGRLTPPPPGRCRRHRHRRTGPNRRRQTWACHLRRRGLSRPSRRRLRRRRSCPGRPRRRFDVLGALGTDFWSSGVMGTASPSFAFTLGGGYTFGDPCRASGSASGRCSATPSSAKRSRVRRSCRS